MAEASTQGAAGPAAIEADQLGSLLQKEFKPKTDQARAAVEMAVRTLAEQALRETAVVSDDVIGTIKAIIAEIDHTLTEQINLILHHEKFQQLEGAWRGLQYLVSNTESDEMTRESQTCRSGANDHNVNFHNKMIVNLYKKNVLLCNRIK